MPKDIVIFNPRGVHHILHDLVSNIAGKGRTVVDRSDPISLLTDMKAAKKDGLILNQSDFTDGLVKGAKELGIASIAIVTTAADARTQHQIHLVTKVPVFDTTLLGPDGSHRARFEQFIKS